MNAGEQEIRERIDEVRVLVKYIVSRKFFQKRYQLRYEFEDLESIAVLCVLENAWRFDCERGTFSTFVGNMAEWGIGKRMQLDRYDKRRTLDCAISLDAPVRVMNGDRHAEPVTLGEVISDGRDWAQESVERIDGEALRALFGELKAVERRVMTARYSPETERVTLAELGKELGVTKERVRQIEENACRRLRMLVRGKEWRVNQGIKKALTAGSAAIRAAPFGEDGA